MLSWPPTRFAASRLDAYGTYTDSGGRPITSATRSAMFATMCE
jgi:hypothetical protein